MPAPGALYVRPDDYGTSFVHAELEGSLNSRVSLLSPAAQEYVAVSVFNHSAILAWTLCRRTARSRKHLPCRATRQMRWLWCVLATEQHRGQRRACSHKSRRSHVAQPTLVEAVGKRMRRSKCGAKGAEVVAVARRTPRGVPKNDNEPPVSRRGPTCRSQVPRGLSPAASCQIA